MHYSYNEFKILPLNSDDISVSDSIAVESRSSEILIYPNPSKGIVNFKFSLELQNQKLEKIEIINSAGMLVKSLTPGFSEEKISWNGKTDSDKRAPSGVYFIRFQLGSKYSTKKFILVR